MIGIYGTGLSISDLPLNESLDYAIENSEVKINLALKMGIKKSDVIKAYVNEKYQELHCSVPEKVIYFSSDEDLLTKLRGTEVQKEEPEAEDNSIMNTDAEDIADITEQLDEQNDIAAPPEPLPIDNNTGTVADNEIEDATVSFSDATSANYGLHEADILATRNKMLEEVIQQNRHCLKEKEEECNRIYDEAMQVCSEQSEAYKAKLDEAEKVIKNLQARIEQEHSAPKGLAAYNIYADKCKAMLKAGISTDTKYPNIIAVMAGGYDSVTTLHQSLALLCASGYNGYILDLMGDPSFDATLFTLKYRYLQIQANLNAPASPEEYPPLDNSMLSQAVSNRGLDLINWFQDENANLDSFVQPNYWQAKVCLAPFFHDIMLLNQDWSKLLARIAASTNGLPVIIMLPTINSFIGRYLASYLSPAITVNITTICAPTALQGTQLNLSPIPVGRVRVLAMNYIKLPETDRILNGDLNKKFYVKPYGYNNFFSIVRPSMENLNSALEENKKIWGTASEPLKRG